MNDDKLEGLLGNHEMFRKLSGHPHSISLMAPIANNMTLLEFFELITSSNFKSWYDKGEHPLKRSFEASLQFMLTKDPKAIELFCLIGLMPGGVTKDCLDKIWGDGWFGYAN